MTEPTRLQPRPGHPFYIYGADIHAEILATLTKEQK